jgi:hypothetical protein
MAAALRTLLRGSERTDEPIRAPFERRRRDSVVGPFPVATDPTRIPRRRDPDELMATISAFSEQESNL